MPVDPAQYPFEPHYFDRGAGVKMHYVDEGAEGQGPPVLMVHGNPSWSFYYRNLVTALSGTHRCIAPDHIGMGLSDKPDDDAYAYTLAQRIDDLGAFIASLKLTEPLTLVMHDWGGMIGMGWAVRHPEQVARLVILNTGAFPLPPEKPFPWPLKLTRTWLGTVLVRGFNAFAYGTTVIGCRRHRMPADIARAYCAPYDSWANRIATLRFVQDIPLRAADAGYDIVKHTEANLHRFKNTPALIGWGGKDFVFDAAFLRQWQQHLPNATVHLMPDVGHYVLEDAADELIPLITHFVRSSSRAVAS
ncbi:alpha/beta fold hydrolase [Gemmatimonas sp.]|uniref:alpha/beta fold hydrolase n=1 Tax=Gemmatimonas sp. TaxID=1962908 RepID=UPI003569C1E1